MCRREERPPVIIIHDDTASKYRRRRTVPGVKGRRQTDRWTEAAHETAIKSEHEGEEDDADDADDDEGPCHASGRTYLRPTAP